MSRTMNGIASSGAGDVKLDGNPNAFTGNNTFDINLPTSTLTTTTSNDDFITKAIGDTIYGSGTGDAILSGGSSASPQQFTGFNVFTNEIEQRGNSTDINSFRQTESSTAVGKGNFIEQDGVGKGHITQRADNSVIRQNGNDTQIIQGTATTTGAVFKQEGDDAEIKQEGIGVEFKQSSTFAALTPNIISTTGFVRAGQPPAIGDDCVNKTYFDANKGTGDALLAGTNAFTGTNTFNTNLPTSSVDTAIGNINDNTILNKLAGDKLYPASADVNECFDDVSISSRTLTFSRVYNANPQDIIIPETDLTGVETIANANYNGVTINGQDLTFTRPSTSNPTTITIPSGGGGGSFVGCKYLNTLQSGSANWEPWMGTSSFIPGKYGGQLVYDTDSIYANSTGYFTIPSGKAGYYNFEVNLIANVFNISGYYTAYLMRLRGGVNTKLAKLHTAYPVGRNYFIVDLTRQFLCNEGDKFYFWTNKSVNSYSTNNQYNIHNGGVAFYKVG